MVNLRFRVCPTCMDKPNPQLKARMAPPDPVPVYDPRPENFIASRYSPSPASGNFIAVGFNTPDIPITTETGSPLEIE